MAGLTWHSCRPTFRSLRQIFDEPKLTGYEVMMDVFPDVFAYGILLVPKGIKDGEKRTSVVVYQHGLEGRPRFVADPKGRKPFVSPLCRPPGGAGGSSPSPLRNLYIFEDRFPHASSRKANPKHFKKVRCSR